MKKKSSPRFSNAIGIHIIVVGIFAFIIGGAIEISLSQLTLGDVEYQTQPTLLNYKCPEEDQLLSDTPLSVEDITAFLGFHHPAFERLMQAKWDYPWFNVQCAVYDNRAYLALYYAANEFIQVYEIEQSNPRLVYEIGDLPPSININVTDFADRNFNGLPDISLSDMNVGNGRCPSWSMSRFVILERDSNGEWHDIAPEVTLVELGGFDDIDSDGIPELTGSKYYVLPGITGVGGCLGQIMTVWYEWNGQDYSKRVAIRIQSGFNDRIFNDMPVSFMDQSYSVTFYAERLACDLINSEREKQFFGVTLLYYYAWGRLDEGWQVVQPIIDVALACGDTPEVREFQETISALRSYFAELP
jgi:hypothetical protein